MNTQQRDFLKIISAALTNQPPDFQGYQLAEDWKRLHKITSEQKLLPMVYDQLYRLPAFQKAPVSLQQKWMGEALAAAGKQVIQIESFAQVCDELTRRRIRYVVLKGISCRVWYAQPELRPSSDEDILIDLENLQACHEVLRELQFINEKALDVPDIQEEQEITYLAQDGSLYLEVHLNAIGKENEMQKLLNEQFTNLLDKTEKITFEGHDFFVLKPTEQMIQLMSHFYKHLYGSGVGIRQMIDLLLGIQKLSERIDWDKFGQFLKDHHMQKLFAAILNAGTDYLHLEFENIPRMFIRKKVRPEALLDDMFAGGIYGFGENNDRKLSGFAAVEIDSGENKWKRILFPSRIRLGDRYPKLREKPYLYPYFVVKRWFELFLEYGSGKEKRELLKKRMSIAEKRKQVLNYYR